MKGAGENAERLQELFGSPQAQQVMENRMIARKAVLKLVDIAMGSTAEAPEVKAEAGKEAKDGDAA
jgi:hypothetical protein